MNKIAVRVEAAQHAASACLESIQPEIDSECHIRSNVEFTFDGMLVLHISASDLHALRAAANTYIRWLDMCLKLSG